MADENIFKAVFDDSDALRFLDNIEKKLGSVGAEADDLKSTLHAAFNEIKSDAKVTGDALGSAFQIGTAQGLTDALKNLQKEYSDLRNASNTLKTSLKSATDPTLVKLYARGIADLEVGMKRLETAGGAAGVNLKKLNESAGTGKQVFEGLFGAIGKTALILGAIEAVRKFVSYAVELSTQITAAKRSIEAFTGSAEEANKIVNSLVATGQKNFIPTDQILKAGKALLAFGENADDLPGVLTRIANVSAATGKNFGELTTIYGKARAAGVLYAEDINQLVDAGIPIIGEFAKQLGVSGAEVKKLASEGKISFEELQLAMFNLTAQGGKFADQAAVQSESIGGAWNKLVATVTPAINTIGTAFSSIVQSGINKLNGLLEFASDVAKRIANGDDYINVSNAGREKADQDASRAQFEKDIDERIRLEKEAADKRNVVVKKSAGELAKAERDREALRISAMKDGLDKELAQEDFRFKELVKQLKKYHLDTSDAEAQHNDNIRDIRLNDIDRQYADIQKSLEIRRKINEADIKAAEQVAKDKKEDVPLAWLQN
jgi:tape measure domain-containing protein